MKLKISLCSLVFAACTLATSQAATLSIVTNADASIRNDGGGPANNFGAATQLVLGSNSGGLNLLLNFSLSGLMATTANQPIIIDSVSLNLKTLASQAGGSGGGLPFTVSLNLYGFDFVEGTGNGSAVAGASSWSNPAGNGSDTTPGGTLGLGLQTLDIGSVATNQSLSFATSANFVNALQAAYDNSDSNIRFILNETTSQGNQSFVRLDSRETSGGTAPTLMINYTVVPEPSAALLGALGLIGVLRRRR